MLDNMSRALVHSSRYGIGPKLVPRNMMAKDKRLSYARRAICLAVQSFKGSSRNQLAARITTDCTKTWMKSEGSAVLIQSVPCGGSRVEETNAIPDFWPHLRSPLVILWLSQGVHTVG